MISNSSSIRSEIEYLHVGAQMCSEMRSGHDGIKQVAPFMASIPYRENAIKNLENLLLELELIFPELIGYGRKRAAKAYKTEKGTITKPSYSGRIAGTDGHSVNQIEALRRIFSKEPHSGGLSFSVFLPKDLIDRQRPGYVPCLLSGTYLLERGELHLSAHFRSQSIVEFGIFDLLNIRAMQMEMVKELNETRPAKISEISCGQLNILCSRIFVHRRIMKIGNKQFLKRDVVLPQWLSTISKFRYDLGYSKLNS